MIILPAIDLKDKKCVRLEQGDYNKVEIFSEDPVSMAQSFEAKGAQYLHMVDLDGAKEGSQKNFDMIKAVRESINIPIQVGGGIRDEDRIKKLLDLGVDRVILGTVAVENPDFLADMINKYGKHIAVSVDAKDGRVATRGWIEDSGVDAVEFVERLEKMGLSTLVFTDISKDGMMEGTNLDLYRELNKFDIDIIASGGVSRKYDIEVLKEIDVYGAIVGKAIYAGALDLEEIVKMAGDK
jgi:phosphoribosylformimino-5-aminoimidazole carboxamide ribotide isomerase